MRKHLVSLSVLAALAMPLAAYAVEAPSGDVRDEMRRDMRGEARDLLEGSVRDGKVDVPALLMFFGDRGPEPVAGDGPGFKGIIVGSLLGVLGGLFGVLSFYGWIAYLGAVAVVMWLARRPATSLLQGTAADFWPSAGRGVLYALFIPLLALVFVISVIGAIPGAMLFLGFFNAALISSVLAGILFGVLLANLVHKRSTFRLEWVPALVGAVLYLLVGALPFVGWIISLVLWLAVLGAVGDRVRGYLKKVTN